MADILSEIVEKRKADIARLGVSFGFDIPKQRQRQVHPFLTEKGARDDHLPYKNFPAQ